MNTTTEITEPTFTITFHEHELVLILVGLALAEDREVKLAEKETARSRSKLARHHVENAKSLIALADKIDEEATR